MTGILGSSVARADEATGPPRRLRGLPPAKSEAVCACAMVLRSVVNKHDRESVKLGETNTVFTAPEIPSISLSDYLKRLCDVGRVSHECVALALIYLDRIVRNPPFPGFAISVRTVHRLLLAGVVVASKAHEERFGDNLWYAKAGGIPLHELNALEITFLSYVKWNLRVTPDTYGAALHRLTQVYANPGAIARARSAMHTVPETVAIGDTKQRKVGISGRRENHQDKRGKVESEQLVQLSAKITSSLQAAKLFAPPSADSVAAQPPAPTASESEGDDVFARLRGRRAAAVQSSEDKMDIEHDKNVVDCQLEDTGKAKKMAHGTGGNLDDAQVSSDQPMVPSMEDDDARSIDTVSSTVEEDDGRSGHTAPTAVVEEDENGGNKTPITVEEDDEEDEEDEEDDKEDEEDAEPKTDVEEEDDGNHDRTEPMDDAECDDGDDDTAHCMMEMEMESQTESGNRNDGSGVIYQKHTEAGTETNESWEFAEVAGSVNRKAARRAAKAEKNAEKAKQKHAKRIADVARSRQMQELREREEAKIQAAQLREKALAAQATEEALRREEDARKKAAEKEGWAAVAAYGAEKREREAVEAKLEKEAKEREAKKRIETEKEPPSHTPPSCPSTSLPSVNDITKKYNSRAEEEYEQNRREWLVAAVRGAEAQMKARKAKQEAEAALKAAHEKEEEAKRLQYEATVEVGKMKRLSEFQGKWSMQLWWSSFNPNLAAAVGSKDGAGEPKRPRLLMMVHARA